MASDDLLATIREAWTVLEPLKAPVALVGGVALSVWNHPRYTRDADLLISAESPSLHEILSALSKAGFRPRHSPAVRQVGPQRFVQLEFLPPEGVLPIQLDLLIAENTDQIRALERSAHVGFPGLDILIDIVRPDDLIAMKLGAGRMIDLADAAALWRANTTEIDLDYLSDVIHRQNLDDECLQAWNDAFPGEALPPQFTRS